MLVHVTSIESISKKVNNDPFPIVVGIVIKFIGRNRGGWFQFEGSLEYSDVNASKIGIKEAEELIKNTLLG